MAYLKGADVSSYQGDIDYSKLKLDPKHDFIICKVCEGIGAKWIDSKFKRNQIEARKAGITLGYYAFVRPDLGNTAEAEADWLLQTIGEIKEGEIIFLDFEVSYNDRVNWCKKWLDRVSSRLNGYKPLIYLNQSLMNNNDWSPVIKGGYGLWLARYDYNPDAPIPNTPWSVLAFRQYSNKDKFLGIPSASVDANVFYGNKTALKAYGYKPAVAPVPTPPDDCEKKLEALLNERNALLSDLNKLQTTYKEYQEAKTLELIQNQKQIESLQKTNAETTAQLSIMAGQVKLATEERKTSQEAVLSLTSAMQERLGEINELKTDIYKLNEKLKKGLNGYSKIELLKQLLKIV